MYWLFYYCELTGYCDLFSISAVGIISSSTYVAENGGVLFFLHYDKVHCDGRVRCLIDNGRRLQEGALVPWSPSIRGNVVM